MRTDPKSTFLPGDPPLEIRLRRSGRARRYSLRISQLDGRVTLTLPPRAPLDDGLAFLNEKADWIRGHLKAHPDQVHVDFGIRVPFEGTLHAVMPDQVRSARVEDGEILVPVSASRPGKRVEALLKLAARDRLAAASDKYAALLGRPYCKLTLRDTRSRWGSCSSTGNLSYSWRLIMAPCEVLDYVAAHEVAHLQEMNHSAAFWAVVERLCPDYAVHRRWLHEHGAGLHRWRFAD